MRATSSSPGVPLRFADEARPPKTTMVTTGCVITVRGRVLPTDTRDHVTDAPYRRDHVNLFVLPCVGRHKSCRSWLAPRRDEELVASLWPGKLRLRPCCG